MKNWKKTATGLLAISILAAGLACPLPTRAAAVNQKQAVNTEYKDGAVIPVSQTEAIRLAAKEKALSQYYITSGRKLEKAVAMLEGLSPPGRPVSAKDRPGCSEILFLPYGQKSVRQLFPACKGLHTGYGNAGWGILYRER